MLIYMQQLIPNKHSQNSEYDQEIPQSQTADNPVEPRGRAAQPSRDSFWQELSKTIKQTLLLYIRHLQTCEIPSSCHNNL